MKRTHFDLRAAAAVLACIILAGLLPVSASAASGVPALETTAAAEDIQKYGNVVLALTCDEILQAGYQYGDVVTVSFLDTTLDLPFCSDYSDVDTESAGVFARAEDTNVKLAINMGDFATTYGIGVHTVEADESVTWNYAENVSGPVAVTISLKEAGGYYGTYLARKLVYSDVRSDYPNLTDEQFANFREVTTTGMGGKVLYRTASPVDPEHNRNTYADHALREAGVTVVMNLTDDEEALEAYEGYAESYYATVSHIALNMSLDFLAPDFQQKLEKGLRYFAENPGVYAVHCTEGKDRAGLVSALLECLMGASAEEVVEDYMVTYYNYYGVTKDEERYEVIADGNIVKTLCRLFDVEDLNKADLSACAERFFGGIGLTEAEIQALKTNLAG